MPLPPARTSFARALPALVLLGGLGLALGTGMTRASETADDDAPDASLPAPKGFALVELFTSEGCSSCPPADRLLARLQADARRAHQPVETLSFHVDYWNDLGWPDPFSSAAASQRQRWYGQTIEPHNVYTPQMVVNGTTAFVGSDARLAGAALGAALAGSGAKGSGGEGGLSLSVAPAAGGKGLVVDYRLPPPGLPPRATLVLAWAQDAGRGQPGRGENAGRTLDHVGVVRDFRVLGAGGGAATPATGRVTLVRPSAVPGRVVGFVQDRASAEVLALAGVAVP